MLKLWGMITLAIAVVLCGAPAGAANVGQSGIETLRFRVGGGNLVTHLPGKPSVQMYEALSGVGAKLGRMDSYGWRDLNRNPTPTDFDAAMMDAYRHRITPIMLLEYEGSYQFLSPPQPIGSREDWYRAGVAYARRFQPNGDWGREHGIVDWGVTVFTAVNEPDVQVTIPRDAYHDALAGFAEGIHSVNRALKVVPGGFATCNSDADATLRGYGTAIADLFEDGHLDGIDLHTYYNERWFPLTKGHYFSAQSCFDRVKEALRIKADIGFYATEYNIARADDWFDPSLAASLFLTAFWDEAGVVGNDRHMSVSRLAFPWNLGDTGAIEGPGYAMAAGSDPWLPDKRAEVLTMILKLAGDMTFSELDPLGTGTYVLTGTNGELHVWQNRPDWTNRLGSTWDIPAPQWATEAELWGWNGLLRKLKPRDGHVVATDLPENQTYMMLFPKSSR
jgi:hypothetical protein